MVTEYVPGKTVGALIGPGGLPLDRTLRYAYQMAAALAAAHRAGTWDPCCAPSKPD
jgi:hypothetical protein